MSVPAPNRSPPHPVASVELDVSAPVRRRRGRLVFVTALAALLPPMAAAGSSVFLWFTTPSGSDLPARVAAIAAGGQLQPAQLPEVLEHAVVAAEGERFYGPPGLGTHGAPRGRLDAEDRSWGAQ